MRKLIDYILSLSKRWGLDQMMKILGYKKVSNEESWTNHIFMKTHTHTHCILPFFKRNRDRDPSILTITHFFFIFLTIRNKQKWSKYWRRKVLNLCKKTFETSKQSMRQIMCMYYWQTFFTFNEFFYIFFLTTQNE